MCSPSAIIMRGQEIRREVVENGAVDLQGDRAGSAESHGIGHCRIGDSSTVRGSNNEVEELFRDKNALYVVA